MNCHLSKIKSDVTEENTYKNENGNNLHIKTVKDFSL